MNTLNRLSCSLAESILQFIAFKRMHFWRYSRVTELVSITTVVNPVIQPTAC